MKDSLSHRLNVFRSLGFALAASLAITACGGTETETAPTPEPTPERVIKAQDCVGDDHGVYGWCITNCGNDRGTCYSNCYQESDEAAIAACQRGCDTDYDRCINFCDSYC